MKIWNEKTSRQHKVLIKLAKNNPHQVFYCAPRFVTYDKLKDYYGNNIILDNTAFFDCSAGALQNLPPGPHYITFTETSNKGYVHSETKDEVIIHGIKKVLDLREEVKINLDTLKERLKNSGIPVNENDNLWDLKRMLLSKYNVALCT